MASSASLTTTHLPKLQSQLQEWNSKQEPVKGFAVSLSEIADPTARVHFASKDVIVAFRTRPPLESEASDKFKPSGAYAAFREDYVEGPEGVKLRDGEKTEVEFCAGISVTSAEPGVLVAHVPGFKWSGPTLTHKQFKADLAFGPTIQNEEVYQRTVVANDILPLVMSGGVGCILAYGQTGSGKTYTMESLEQQIASDIFKVAAIETQKFLGFGPRSSDR